jgi:hypothetical protein
VLRYNSSAGTWDASATAGIVAADTASMLNAYPRGSGTANQVAYWDGTRSLTGSSSFLWDNSSKKLTIDGYIFKNMNNAARNNRVMTIKPESATYDSSNAIIEFIDKYDAANSATFVLGQSIANGWFSKFDGYVFQSTKFGSATTKNIYFLANDSYATTTSALSIMANTNRIGIKQNTPSYILDINATDAIRLPVGTTAQRPTGASGVLRFNSDSTGLEYHNGTSWRGIVNTWDASTGGGSSVWSTTADTVYLPSNKYVGIGTASPDSTLHVEGSAYLSGYVNANSGFESFGKIILRRSGISSTTRDISFLSSSNSENVGSIFVYPVSTGANAGASLTISPKGTGGSGVYSQITLHSRDAVADGVNTSFAVFRATGSAYGLLNQKNGTASLYPIFINAKGTFTAATSQAYFATDGKVGFSTTTPTAGVQIKTGFALTTPVTVNVSTYTIGDNDNWLICTYSGTTTFTMPDPTTCSGRVLHFLNRANQTRLGSVSEIIPLAGGSATTTIVTSTAGKWVTLVSDGTYWQTVEGN